MADAICTREQLDEILADVERSVEAKVNAVMWKILGIIAIPLIGFAVAWGSIYMQVNRNTDVINTQVLTVKDKENLQNQIASVLTSVNDIKADIRDIKNTLK